MKIAVLADIHGNWPALEATAADIDSWQPDLVLVNGDIVNSGPDSAVCWRYVADRRARDGWIILRGNHEDYVSEWAGTGPPLPGPAYELIRLSEWTYRRMPEEAAGLAALPDSWQWQAPDESRLVAMHGSVIGNRAGIYPHTPDDEAARKIVHDADVFVTAHTHIPHLRRLNGTQVVNVGSVGLPGDRDGRAAYGRIEWQRERGWTAEVVRVAYDRTRAEEAYFTSGYVGEAGPEAEMSLVEFRMALDVRTRWSAVYRQRILDGQISHAAAVREFLELPEFRPFALYEEPISA